MTQKRKSPGKGTPPLAPQGEYSARMLRKFIDSTDVGMYVTDYETGEILLANRVFTETLGNPELPDGGVQGKCCWRVAGPPGDTFCPYCPRDKLLDEKGKPLPPYRWENQNPLTGQWLRCTNQAIEWEDGRLAHMVTYLDVTEEHNMRQQLAHLAYFDNQLGLANAQRLQQDMREEYADAMGSFVVFDITMLRSINNMYGRAVGDALLQEIVNWVKAQNFPYRQFYRVEGDEFCLYFEPQHAAKAEEVARRLCQRFDDGWDLQMPNGPMRVVCSAWVALVPKSSHTTADNILDVQRRALDTARRSEGIVVYDKTLDLAHQHRTRTEIALQECVAKDMQGFAVHYQPIIDPAAGTWQGIESLCRWNSPHAGAVPPLVFIRMAEQMGLIKEIGLWVLKAALRQCMEWGLDGQEGFFVSVNLSPIQLMDARFVDEVVQALEQSGYPGSKLFFEITESTEFLMSSHTLHTIERLRRRGVHFSLDDFGTGYSSFNNLKNIPVKMLKIEREFVSDIEKDEYMQYYFNSMAQLAHAADMKLLAEGVENEEQLRVVLRNDADLLQGYFFSRPLPPQELEQQLHRFRQVDPAFYVISDMEYSPEHLLAAVESYKMSPSLLRVLHESLQILLGEEEMEGAFGKVLEIVCRQLKVPHGYVVLARAPGEYRYAGEWCAPSVPPDMPRYQHIQERKIKRAILTPLKRDGMLVCNDVQCAAGAVAHTFSRHMVKAMVLLPVHLGAEAAGYVGFDAHRFREWAPGEIVMLRNLAYAMSSYLKRHRNFTV